MGSGAEGRLLVEDYALVCLDPITGSVVRGKNPFGIWPPPGPAQLHVPSLCLLLIEPLLTGDLSFDGRRLTTDSPAEPIDPLVDEYLRVTTAADGDIRNQLHEACTLNTPACRSELAPWLGRRWNPWYRVIERLAFDGLVEVDGTQRPLGRRRVRVTDSGRRSQTQVLVDIRRAVRSDDFTNPQICSLICALNESHLSKMIDPKLANKAAKNARSCATWPPGVQEVWLWARKVVQNMTTAPA